MKKLVIISLFSLLTVVLNAQQTGSKITFAKLEHNFGKIKEVDGKAEVIFEFTNTGTSPLILQNVEASCGCTIPDWSKVPVLPGQKSKIKAVYDPNGRPGKFEKSVTVESNASNGTIVLKIEGEVIPKALATPKQ